MDDYRMLWRLVQEVLEAYWGCFTEPGFGRFCEWVVGMMVNMEEHTITQALSSMGLEEDWAASEAFAERGAWDVLAVAAAAATLAQSAGAPWCGYRVWAVDDTKVHRSSKDVWGVNSYYEYTARCPNRATTVWAHNWVVARPLMAGRPWVFLPAMGRLYFRATQLPAGETFATKTELAEAMLRAARAVSEAALLACMDGGYAHEGLLRGLLKEDPEEQIDWVTRLRWDARLYAPVEPKPAGCPGPTRTWGKRLPAPRDHERWAIDWHEGRAWVYGKVRTLRWKECPCIWRVSGPEAMVRAFVLEVEGQKKPWALVTSSARLRGEQVVEAFAARFRQENGFRDLKQRLGAEECRASTKNPILRTFLVQMVTLTLMHLLRMRLTEEGGDGWWSAPPWNRHKTRPSLRDVHRLVWQASGGFGQLVHQGLTFIIRRRPRTKGRTRRSRRRKAA